MMNEQESIKTVFQFAPPSRLPSRPQRLDFNNSDKIPCAVIVTIFSESSYDDMYRSIPQVAPDPMKYVALFEFKYSHIPLYLNSLSDDNNDDMFKDLKTCISQVESSSVVFNFECCSFCSEDGFNEEQGAAVMNLLHWVIKNRYQAMFGDYSLKGLIRDWSENLLGPNPFVMLGTTSTKLSLRFEPDTLKNSSNAQLRNVGDMCESGNAIVNVMCGTIVFTVSHNRPATELYDLEVLTICSPSNITYEETDMLEIGQYTGTAGHVTLKYNNGGSILVSAGHWIELCNLHGASEESVLRSCGMQLGVEEQRMMESELRSAASSCEREVVVQRRAQQVVMSSAPCMYSR